MKQRIIDDENVELILEKLGCHAINDRGDEYRAALPDGDNPTSISILKDNLFTKVYTRKDFPDKADIITLVEYIRNEYFTKALYWICQTCDYEYYGKEEKIEDNIDPCLEFLEEVQPKSSTEEEKLRLYDESVLSQYVVEPNMWFCDDGISTDTQRLFEVAWWKKEQRIVIPIRDEMWNLVGVKSRTTDNDYKEKKIPKYNYPYKTSKTHILYGLHISLPYIQEKGSVMVFESEKSVQQCYTMGIRNVVAIGGHDLSDTQVMKLERLNVPVLLCYDKGIEKDELIKESNKFMIKDRVYCLYDKDGLLNDKESPSDKGKEILLKLIKNNRYRMKK